MLNGKEQTEKLKELNNIEKLVCSDLELEEYTRAGLLFKSGRSYITRAGKKIKVDLIKSSNYEFLIDLGDIIRRCEELALESKIKRIYCMSKTTYEKFKNQKYIVEKDGIEYYRLFTNELWRIIVI